MTTLEQYLERNRRRFEDELGELLRIPSISAHPNRRPDMLAAAEWLAGQFARLEMKAEIIPTVGHPLVYAESPPVPGAPTVLVYGHYDVQPPEPLELWESPPFEPTERDGDLYARGATDDKGQLYTHLKGAEAARAAFGPLPVQLKFLIEGEEETGSAGLQDFLSKHADRLACDLVVISDGGQFAPGQPAITYGLRGIAYYELRLTGPSRDLHSGTFGGSVLNPANVLATMLAGLVDARGRVQVPHFYDDVAELSADERGQLAALPFDEAGYMQRIDVAALGGEAGYSTLERRWIRPTCDINGLTSGYQGEGAKTVLPAKASAKFSFRLVPHQDPAAVTRHLQEYLHARCPAGITMELIDFHGCAAVVVPLDSPYVEAAARAIEAAFGRPPVYTREGGSIPIVASFHRALGVDTLLIGWGQDDDNTHSPNEKFSLQDFHRGIHASALLWRELAQLKAD